MFQHGQTKHSSFQRRTTIAILVAILGAMVITWWLILELRQEQSKIEEMLRSGDVHIANGLRAMSETHRWQLPLTVLVLLVLSATAITRVLIAQAYAVSQQSLKNTNSLAWHIFASLDQGLVTTNTDGVVTSANPEFYRLFNLGERLVGRSLSQLCQEGNWLAEITRRVLQTHVAEHDQDFTLLHNGHQLRLRAHCNLLRNDEEIAGVILYIRDVTERHFVEEQLRRMERYMGLGSMVASLHHEINNPLSALSLHLQLLDERLVQYADDDVRETMQIVRTEIARITGALNGFREYASVTAISRGPTDLGKVVRQTVNLVSPHAELQEATISTRLPPDLPLVEADAALLEQLLLNLVLNALEAMPQGGQLCIGVTCAVELIELTVSDSGIGIPTDLHSRVFDPFFTTKLNGSGLGLAFCEKIVREHAGEINFETGPGGTTFFVKLPCPALGRK